MPETKRYQIELPDGSAKNITLPVNASAAQVIEALSGQLNGPPSAGVANDGVSAELAGGLRGATLGLAPHIMGAIGGPELKDQFNESANRASGVGEFVGGFVPGAGVAGLAARGARGLLSGVGRQAGAAALEGGVAGAAYAPEGERVPGAALGGILGGALGGAIPAVGAGINAARDVGRAGLARARHAYRQVTDPEYRLSDSLSEFYHNRNPNVGGRYPIADNPNSVLADYSPDFQQSARQAAQQHPGGAATLKKFVSDRHAGQGRRILEATRSSLGNPPTAKQAKDAWEAVHKRGQDLYKQADAALPTYEITPELEAIMAATPKRFFNEAVEGVSMRSLKKGAAPATDAEGRIIRNPQYWHSVSGAVRDARDSAGRAGNAKAAADYGALYNAYSEVFEAQNPVLRDARTTWAQYTGMKDDFNNARKAATSQSVTADQLEDAVQSVAEYPERLTSLRAGYQQGLADLASRKGIKDDIVPLFNSEGSLEKIAALGGDPSALTKVLDDEARFASTYRRTANITGRGDIADAGSGGKLAAAGDAARLTAWQSKWAQIQVLQKAASGFLKQQDQASLQVLTNQLLRHGAVPKRPSQLPSLLPTGRLPSAYYSAPVGSVGQLFGDR